MDAFLLLISNKASAEPLRVAYTSIAVAYGPLRVTREAGIFKKYKIGVKPQRLTESRFNRELVSSGFLDGPYRNP